MGELLPKGNRQQTWLPISIWWLPNTQSGPTARQTKPMSQHAEQTAKPLPIAKREGGWALKRAKSQWLREELSTADMNQSNWFTKEKEI